jgi:hypothetical protein
MTDTVALLGHGSVGYGRNGQRTFNVPGNIEIGFFYDYTRENAVLCFDISMRDDICKQPPKQLIGPGQPCIDLTISRGDDINHPSGFYVCGSGNQYIEVPGLGPTVVQTPPKNNSVFLSDTIEFLSRSFPENRIRVMILVCALSQKSYIHESRREYTLPLYGETAMTQTQYADVKAQHEASRYIDEILQQNPQFKNPEAQNYLKGLYDTKYNQVKLAELQKKGGRKQRKKTRYGKNKKRRTRRR